MTHLVRAQRQKYNQSMSQHFLHSVGYSRSKCDFSPTESLRAGAYVVSMTIMCPKDVLRSFRNVRHLCLRVSIFETKGMVDHLFSLMPNIRSLRIKKSGLMRTSSIQNIVSCLRRSPHRLVKLDLWVGALSDIEMTHLVNLYSESLQSLWLDECDKLEDATFAAIGNCSQLRHLSLKRAHALKDATLRTFC